MLVHVRLLKYKIIYTQEVNQGCHPLEKIHDVSQTVKQFSLTLQDDYSGHESTKIRMT